MKERNHQRQCIGTKIFGLGGAGPEPPSGKKHRGIKLKYHGTLEICPPIQGVSSQLLKMIGQKKRETKKSITGQNWSDHGRKDRVSGRPTGGRGTRNLKVGGSEKDTSRGGGGKERHNGAGKGSECQKTCQ